MKSHVLLARLVAAVTVFLLFACDGESTAARPRRSKAVPSTSVPAAPAKSVRTVTVPAPFEPITGQQLVARLAHTKKQGSVVNAWASWCGPCKRELPMLAALAQTQQDLAVVFVSVDEPSAWDEAAAILRSHGIASGAYVVAERLGPFKAALHPGWKGMIPATFLFDASGRRRYFWGGPVYEHELLPVVEGFLRGEPIDGEARFGLAPGKIER